MGISWIRRAVDVTQSAGSICACSRGMVSEPTNSPRKRERDGAALREPGGKYQAERFAGVSLRDFWRTGKCCAPALRPIAARAPVRGSNAISIVRHDAVYGRRRPVLLP